jgi:hypothetical protein
MAQDRRSPAFRVRTELRELGYRVPDVADNLLDGMVERDLRLLSVDVDGLNPWLVPAETVPRRHLFRVSAREGDTTCAAVAELTDGEPTPPPPGTS